MVGLLLSKCLNVPPYSYKMRKYNLRVFASSQITSHIDKEMKLMHQYLY